MSDIYTGIDIGTNSIKIVVSEKTDDKYNILASVSSPSSGVQNGFIVDMKKAVKSVKNALDLLEKKLGFRVSKVIAVIPPIDCSMDIVSSTCDIENLDEITGKEISMLFSSAFRQHNFKNRELVTAMPINFTIDNRMSVNDPRGMSGERLDTRIVISSSEKEPLYRILEVLRLSGLEVVDICYGSFGDYYALSNKKNNELVGAIINIGEEVTNVSIFNRGIQIKNGVIPIGSIHVDRDLSYVFKSSVSEARKMKENFSIAVTNYASTNDSWDLEINKSEIKEVSQVGASKVVEARLRELLKLAKNEIKNLTNREIRYIIITGGLSEIAGFQYLVEQVFGVIAKVGKIPNIGIRHNKYSSCFGVIKFFNDKLELRDKHYNMFSEEELDLLHRIDNINI